MIKTFKGFGGAWLCIFLLAWFVVTGARGDAYRCLNVWADDRLRVVDVASGRHLPDARRARGIPSRIFRGTLAPDGTRRAYLNASEHVARLYVEPTNDQSSAWADEPNTEREGASLPTMCAGVHQCWYSRTQDDGNPAGGAFRFGVGANQSAWLAWSPGGDRIALGWIDPDGWLWAALADKSGALTERRRIDHSLTARASLGEAIPLGWSPDGTWIAFVTVMRQHNAVYFWQPARGDKGDMLRVMRLDERLPSLAVIAQANWSPDSRKLAYLIPSGGYTHLVISDPQAQSEVGYVLKPLLDARLTWSADNRFLALQYFEAPYWRMNIYDLSARSDGVMYDVGGVVPSDMPSLRNGRPALAWSRDGRTLAFVREIGIGRFALSAFGLGTGRYMNLLSDVKGDMLVSPRGRIAVVMHTPNGKLNFAVIDADGQNLRYLAQEVDAINDAQWRGDETLLYSTTRGEAKSLYLVNGDVQTALAEGITNYGLVRGLGVVRFKWDAPDGAHGYRIQDLDGDLRADYRTMSSVVPDRPVYPAPDGNLAAFYVISPKALGVQVASADGRYTSPLLADNVGPGLFGNLAWSPDSRHVALVYFVSGTQGQQIMEIFSAEGQRLRTVDEFKQYYDILEWTRCD